MFVWLTVWATLCTCKLLVKTFHKKCLAVSSIRCSSSCSSWFTASSGTQFEFISYRSLLGHLKTLKVSGIPHTLSHCISQFVHLTCLRVFFVCLFCSVVWPDSVYPRLEWSPESMEGRQYEPVLSAGSGCAACERRGQWAKWSVLQLWHNYVIAKNEKTALNLMYTIHFIRMTGIFIVSCCCCFSLNDYFIILKGLMSMIYQICSHLILSGICL